MKASHLILFLVLLLQGCASFSPGRDSDQLAFYIVSAANGDNRRFIDTADFPQLGYISPAPDLVVHRLKSVGAVPFQSGVTNVDFPPLEELPTVVIFFREEDMSAFKTFSHRASGRMVLMTVGDTPLGVTLFSRLLEPTNQLIFTLGAKGDRPRINHEFTLLKRLAQ